MLCCFDNNILPEVLSIKSQKSVGFRNISVYRYNDIDRKLVFDIIYNHPVLREFS